MPDRKRPTPEDTVTARRILLDGLTLDAGIFDLAGELAPLHPRNNTFPGEVLLHLAADALDWCGASPLSLEGIPDRFLPECTFRAFSWTFSITHCDAVCRLAASGRPRTVPPAPNGTAHASTACAWSRRPGRRRGSRHPH